MTSKKLVVFQIQLKDNRLVFYSGEKLEGKVVLQLSKHMEMECLKICCKGKVKTEWEDHVTIDDTPQIRKFISNENLITEERKLFESAKSQKHPEGLHEYPFSFQLHHDFPSSFEGQHGHVRYELKVKIKRERKPDIKQHKMFVVNEVIDVNNEKFSKALGDSVQSTLGCLCCESGPLSLSASIDRTGYCPGENISVTANVSNKTGREITCLTAELKQAIEFKGSHEESDIHSTKTSEEVIGKISSKAISKGDSFHWQNEPIRIPPLAPSLKSRCISVSYYAHLQLNVPMGFDLEIKLPITIGTIPFIPMYGSVSEKKNEHYLSIGKPPVHFLGHPTMHPFTYCSLNEHKPVKFREKEGEKDYKEQHYVPCYGFARPNPDVQTYHRNELQGLVYPFKNENLLTPVIE